MNASIIVMPNWIGDLLPAFSADSPCAGTDVCPWRDPGQCEGRT